MVGHVPKIPMKVNDGAFRREICFEENRVQVFPVEARELNDIVGHAEIDGVDVESPVRIIEEASGAATG